MKHRFSDFIVNEIDINGDVVWFQPETNLQKWKKANIEHTLPGMVYEEDKQEEVEEIKQPEKKIDVDPLALE